MGGTFMSMPEDYRGKFIAQLHNALSGFTGTDVDEAVRSAHSLFTVTRLLIPVLAGILSRVNQKLSVSQSRPARITVYVPI